MIGFEFSGKILVFFVEYEVVLNVSLMNNYCKVELALANCLFFTGSRNYYFFFNQEITYCHIDLSKELRPADSDYCRSAQF